MKTSIKWLAIAASALLAAAIPTFAQTQSATPAKTAAQKTFTSPEDAAKALADAVRASDVNMLLAVVGPDSRSWLLSGDNVADRESWKRFLAAYDQKNVITRESDVKAVLSVGDDGWPFPAPIAKKGSKWMFDIAAGKEEVLNRRIGRNELDTVQTMLAIVDAQREYAAVDRDGNGLTEYARKFISSPARRTACTGPPRQTSRQARWGRWLAQPRAKAMSLGQRRTAAPYHGYHYHMLTAQGKAAPGGAFDYLVNGRMIGGFAVVGYPDKYGVSGVMTFIVNYDGVVYEKNLGPSTQTEATRMTRFNPDQGWKKSE